MPNTIFFTVTFNIFYEVINLFRNYPVKHLDNLFYEN